MCTFDPATVDISHRSTMSSHNGHHRNKSTQFTSDVHFFNKIFHAILSPILCIDHLSVRSVFIFPFFFSFGVVIPFPTSSSPRYHGSELYSGSGTYHVHRTELQLRLRHSQGPALWEQLTQSRGTSTKAAQQDATSNTHFTSYSPYFNPIHATPNLNRSKSKSP